MTLQDVVLGSVEDEIDMDEMESSVISDLPADAHSIHRMNLSFFKLRDQLSVNLGGNDNFVASKLMVNLLLLYVILLNFP